MQQEKKQGVFAHLLSGGLAGVVADGVVHPIDTVRTRLMTQHAHQQQYNSATHALRTIFKQEGVKGLYKGFSAVAVGTIPGHALYFAGYEGSKKYLNQLIGETRDSNFAVHLVAGFIADVCGSLAWTPMDVVKQRLQIQRQQGKYLGSWDAVKKIVQEDGPRGLFRGMGAALLTYGPYVSLYLALYEQAKLYSAKQLQTTTNQLPFYVYLLGAGIAGSVSAGITTPLDVIKTRIQTQESKRYKHAWHAYQTIVKEEGWQVLFNGLKPRCLWMAGGTAVTMMACKYTCFHVAM